MEKLLQIKKPRTTFVRAQTEVAVIEQAPERLQEEVKDKENVPPSRIPTITPAKKACHQRNFSHQGVPQVMKSPTPRAAAMSDQT